MANEKVKPQGGNGKGHSAMCHWSPTAWIKQAAKKMRRMVAKKEILDSMKEV